MLKYIHILQVLVLWQVSSSTLAQYASQSKELPNTSPGPYLQAGTKTIVQIPPPPVGYPALVLPPATNTSATSASSDPPGQRLKPAKVVSPVEKSKCVFSIKTANSLYFKADGGTQQVKLQIMGGRSCLKGIGTSASWITVSDLSVDYVLKLQVEANEEGYREGEVHLAGMGQTLTLQISQD